LQEFFGIFGGSFDPPHKAHVQCLESLVSTPHREFFSLQKIYIVPSKFPPGKTPGATYDQRLEWSQKSFRHPSLEVVDWEAPSETTVFAHDLVLKAELKEPEARWMWILGEDQLKQLPYWHQIDRYAARILWGVFPRSLREESSFPGGVLSKRLQNSTAPYVWLESPLFPEISSTEVRHLCEEGDPVQLTKLRESLPKGLEEEIITYYQNNSAKQNNHKGGKN
jgi:nicotinate-nucleotide adenylyltransferase